MTSLARTAALCACMLAIGLAAAPLPADSRPLPPPPTPPSYADLADLADGTPLVIRAQVRKLVQVEPARAQGVKPGWGRFYVEARTEALLGGRGAVGEALRYLVDLRLDPKGRAPALRKKSVVLFARPVAGKPGELQLVAPDAQVAWDEALGPRLTALLAELYAPGAPKRVSGVREAVHVAGTLAGEGETQLFLATANGEPAAATVTRSPGAPVGVSVSFSELVGTSNGAPPRDTLGWYRLACFLPADLPAAANISGTPADKAAAAADYQALRDALGPCQRTRK